MAGGCYLSVNMVVSLLDKPVYHVLTYTNMMSIVYVLATFGLIVIGFLLFKGLSVYKRNHFA